MYTLVKATGILKGINQRWHVIDLTDKTVKTLYETYRTVYLTLSLETPENLVYVDLETLKPVYSQFEDSVGALLLAQGNTPLETLDSLPDINTRTYQYKDAYRAGYQVTPIHPEQGTNAAPEYRSALLLTRQQPVTDYAVFHQHCLVTVNGFCHLTDTNGSEGVIVYDGMTSARRANQNQVGILSFLKVGAIECVPITESMVYKQDEDEPYAASAYLKLNRDLTGKTVFLVLGGYFHTHQSELFQYVSDDVFKIDFSNYPLLDRYYESNHYLDLSSLGLSTTPMNPSQVSIEELRSDAVLLKYLTLSQSFFVILDAPEVFINKQYIKKTGLPGMYISYKKPLYPIVVGLGRLPEYWVTAEDGQYSMTVFDNSYRRRIYDTTDPLQLNSVSDSTLPIDPELIAGAYFLELGRDI